MPSTSTLMLPSGSLRLCTMLTMVPTWKMSPALGSSMLASCWVARNIFLSLARASSSARTLESRPTTNGVIMYGKMTTSRMGIMGSRFVSDFSFEVSINVGEVRKSGSQEFWKQLNSTRRSSTFLASRLLDFPASGRLARFFKYRHADLLVHDHFLGHQKFANFFVRREVIHQIQHELLQDHSQASRSNLPL